MDPEIIEQLLREHLQEPHVAVSGDGRHFQALVVTPEFEALNRIQRHRRVNHILREHIDSDLLHAISMRTLTPVEWQQAAG